MRSTHNCQALAVWHQPARPGTPVGHARIASHRTLEASLKAKGVSDFLFYTVQIYAVVFTALLIVVPPPPPPGPTLVPVRCEL